MMFFFWACIVLTTALVGWLGFFGYQFFTSGEDLERREKAKGRLLIGAICAVVLVVLWLIYFLVSRNQSPVAQNNTNSANPCADGNCLTTTGGTFNLTGVTTCAARPNYADNVPRTSAVILTFNADLKPATVAKAVTDAPANGPKIVIEQCDDQNCAKPSTPKAIEKQSLSGNLPAGKAGQTKAEWVAMNNTIAFYHTSFSADEKSADNRWFAAKTWYRVTIPKGSSSAALQDLRNRVLAKCQKTSGEPIEGNHCTEKDDRLLWTFQTGAETGGGAPAVRTTIPSSTYLAGSGVVPDRDVNRAPILGFDATTAVDPTTISAATFSLMKLTTEPNPQTGLGGKGAAPLAADLYTVRVNSSGTGAWFQLKNGQLLDPLTWYQVTVSGVKTLCGGTDALNATWVFQTNDVTPGILQAYPKNGYQFACPTTKAFVQYATSMWRIEGGSDDCAPGSAGSFVVDGGLAKANGRTLAVMDPFNPDDPNHSCTMYGFTPAQTSLLPNTTYHGGINSQRTGADGEPMNFGDTPPAKSPSGAPWSFTVAPADTCIQPPIITAVAPSQGANGQCLTVLGDYFEKKTATGFETDGQSTGDALALGGLLQKPTTWIGNAIVANVSSETLAANQKHAIKVTVNYPAPIGPLTSNEVPFRLLAGSGSVGPCLQTLSSYRGPAGSVIGATGTKFGAYSGKQSAILSSRYSAGWAVDGAKWSDAAIGPAAITVAAKTPAGDGLVRVRDAAGLISNPLPYAVSATGPTTVSAAPRVEESTSCNPKANSVPSPNPMRGDSQACVNAQITARFTVPINPKTLHSGTVTLERCPDGGTCQRVPASVIAYPQSLTLVPAAVLATATKYRVTISTGVKSTTGISMTLPYTWDFTTVNTAADCPITGLAIAEPSRIFKTSFRYPIHALTTDATCHTLNPKTLTYAWSTSNSAVAALIPKATGRDNVASGPSKPSATGEAAITVKAQNITSAPITLSYLPTRCTTDSDCGRNALGESCPGSTCVNNACRPVVNALEPNNGTAGTWTTIKGCWFGGAVDGKSSVQTANSKTTGAPDPGLCGDTWTNERIIREIPSGTTSGALTVVRADGQRAATATFTANATSHPNICKVNPDRGLPGDAVAIIGNGFGNSQASGDTVTFTKSASSVPATSALSWKGTHIDATIPAEAMIGTNEIRIRKGAKISNPWTFGVLDAEGKNPDLPPAGAGEDQPSDDPGNTNGSTNDNTNSGDGSDGPPCDGCGNIGDPPPTCQACTPTTACASGQGCGYNFCCGPQPVQTTFSPAAGTTNICRNLQIRLGFSQPLDGATVNDATVVYEQGSEVLTGAAGTETDGTAGTIVLRPGTLKANTAQKITLGDGIKSDLGVPARITTSPISYTTSANMCVISQVEVTADDTLFTRAGETHRYTARALSADGTIIDKNSDFPWTWSWTSSDPTIAAAITADLPESTVTATKPVKNGTANITATAAPSNGEAASGTLDAVVDACDEPWVFPDTETDIYHFQLHYCPAGADRPLFAYRKSSPPVSSGSEDTEVKLLYSYFFKENSGARDAIGVRIHANTERRSPADWIAARFPTVTGGESTSVGGYPAVRIGSTTYVHFLDLTGGTVQSYVMVIDYNSADAKGPTANVFNAILERLRFNTNLTNSVRATLQRDAIRLGDVRHIQTALDGYKKSRDGYPTLPSGSYLVNFTTSAWPSWQSVFGAALGTTLPTDPRNSFARVCSQKTTIACTTDADCGAAGGSCSVIQCVSDSKANASYEAASCWSEAKKTFQCPAGSSVYGYASNGPTYHVYAAMETSQLQTKVTGACSSPNTCPCFTYDSLAAK